MNPIASTQEILKKTEEFLKQLPTGAIHRTRLAQMAVRLEQPCVLAVAGKVKAGKSSFLNALIGTDLAKVGELETTATINRFCYGIPDDPEHPVKVVWENGMETYETKEFMDSLQGRDSETLKKAEGIAYLEFKLEHELLKEVTLVDTPGTDAVVGEEGDAHQAVTEAYFNLRQKHKEQTLNCTSAADAVIYLVGAVATVNAQKFLSDFQSTSAGASALNAIGVLSKVDIDRVLLERRNEQASYVADSLRDQLNTVVPVSAGLHMAILEHGKEFGAWQQKLKQMPPKAFQYLMKQESIFFTERQDLLEVLYKGSPHQPLPLAERKALKGNLFWSLFRTIANVLYETATPEEAVTQLKEMANMEGVRSIIMEQFFNRSKIIRCYHILSELYALTKQVCRNDFDEMKREARKADLWIKVVHQCHGVNEEDKRSLLEFIRTSHPTSEEVERLWERFRKEIIIPLENIQQELEEYDMDYQMLKLLQAHRKQWMEEEYQELCSLFGLYGQRNMPEEANSYERQGYWRRRSLLLSDRHMKRIAEHAAYVYGEL